jgi:hypothetical protein
MALRVPCARSYQTYVNESLDMSSSTAVRHTAVLFISLVLASSALAVAVYVATRSPSREIVLVDENGRPRVRLAATAEGGTIELLDDVGGTRLALRQQGTTTAITIHRSGGEVFDHAMQVLIDDETHTYVLSIRDEAGSVMKLGSGGLTVRNKSGEANLTAGELGARLRLGYGSQFMDIDLGKAGANITAPDRNLRLNGRETSIPH